MKSGSAPIKIYSVWHWSAGALLLLTAFVCFSNPVQAQTIYWKKDYINDPNGTTVAVATPPPTDYQSPTTPSVPAAGTKTSTTIPLTWTGSTDDVEVAGYIVYRGAIPIAAVSGLGFSDDGLTPNTLYSYRIVAFDKAHNYSSFSTTLSTLTEPATNAPKSLTDTVDSTTQITLSWTVPDSGAPDHYGIWQLSSGTWTKIDTTTLTYYVHSGRTANTAYLYKVSSENSSNVVGAYSNLDLATTIVFTDGTLTSGSSVIKAVHVTELRTAVNAVRSLAGLSNVSWTNSSISGAWINAVDITELRTGLGPAINLLGLPSPNYDDSILSSRIIDKDHISQLRQRVQ